MGSAAVEAAIENKDHEIEILKDLTKSMLQRVKYVEAGNEALNKKVDSLYMTVKKMGTPVSTVGNDDVRLPTMQPPSSSQSYHSSAQINVNLIDNVDN